MKRYSGFLPLNSRITIDYTKKDPVRFEYVKKRGYWHSVMSFGYPTVLNFCFSFIIPLFFNAISLSLVALAGLVFLYKYAMLAPYTTTSFDNPITTIMVMAFVVFLVYGVPFLFTVLLALDKKSFSIVVPKMAYYSALMMGSAKERTITSFDSKEFILPYFKNVFLDYTALGECGLFLERVEIVEHKIELLGLDFLVPWKVKRSKNEYFWTAKFTFTHVPRQGLLKLTYS